jgi:phage terminase Nu1 subunit (DNA packaging protein)
MTQVQYAAHRGCSKQNIGKLVKAGKIVLDENGLIDSDRADEELKTGLNPAHAMGRVAPAVSPQSEKYGDAKARIADFQAKAAEIEWAERVGLVVDATGVESEQMTFGRRVRDRILRIEREAAGELAACADERGCQAILHRFVTAALTDIADIMAGAEEPTEDDDD